MELHCEALPTTDAPKVRLSVPNVQTVILAGLAIAWCPRCALTPVEYGCCMAHLHLDDDALHRPHCSPTFHKDARVASISLTNDALLHAARIAISRSPSLALAAVAAASLHA